MTIKEIYKVELERSVDGRTIISERWVQGEDLSRLHGPAFIELNHRSGRLHALSWWRKGELHRVGGPALLTFHEDGTTVAQSEWRLRGRLHCRKGPARIVFDSAGRVRQLEWWIEGRKMWLDL